jgi:lipid-binding SYLF domain-containing protein
MASRRAFVIALTFGLVSLGASGARADDVLDARHTMEEASITVDRLREETSKSGELDNLLREAKGVLIIPSFYKAGFFIGGAYGDGVLLKRISATEFGDPAFYRMTAGSLGLQIGMQSAEIVFVIRTEKGLAAVLNDEFKMGANASIAVGSIGAGAEAATTTHVGKDIIAYSKNSGLFAGGAFEGAAIKPRKDWNAAVYGVDKSDPRLIIQRSGLRAALNLKDTLNRSGGAAAPAFSERPAAAESSDAPRYEGSVSGAQSPGAVTSTPLSSPVQPESN